MLQHNLRKQSVKMWLGFTWIRVGLALPMGRGSINTLVSLRRGNFLTSWESFNCLKKVLYGVTSRLRIGAMFLGYAVRLLGDKSHYDPWSDTANSNLVATQTKCSVLRRGWPIDLIHNHLHLWDPFHWGVRVARAQSRWYQPFQC